MDAARRITPVPHPGVSGSAAAAGAAHGAAVGGGGAQGAVPPPPLASGVRGAAGLPGGGHRALRRVAAGEGKGAGRGRHGSGGDYTSTKKEIV